MSKRWTLKEDLFLVDFFEAIGDLVGPHDLGRPIGAATKRVKKLKDTGVWDLLKNFRAKEFECLDAYYTLTGNEHKREFLGMMHSGSPDHAPPKALIRLPALQ